MDPLTPPPRHTALGPKILDGGLATALRSRRLGTDVHRVLDEKPEAIETIHRSFVDAGAIGLLTGTFRALPHLDPDWDRHAEVAVDLASMAAAGRAWLWGSLGPAGDRGSSWHDATASDRRLWIESWRRAARRLHDRVHGFVLETFIDVEEARAALAAVKDSSPDLAVAVSLVPTTNGKLHSGEPVRHALETLRLDGADIVGFNCGTDPDGVERAIRACRGVGPLWAKPAGGRRVQETLVRMMPDCDWIGGCCGVTYKDIALLARHHAESRA